jgi:hypothetical protein
VEAPMAESMRKKLPSFGWQVSGLINAALHSVLDSVLRHLSSTQPSTYFG